MPWRAAGCCNRGIRTPSMAGYRRMKRKAWPDSWYTNMVATAGGDFAEVEAVKEELVEILRAGPGEAARQEVAATKSGPVPGRWTLRTIRTSVDWLTEYTVSGVWRMLRSVGLGLHTSCARWFSPDPDYCSKVRRLHRCLRDAARHPGSVMRCFWMSLATSAGRKLPRCGACRQQSRNARVIINNGARSARSMR
jgi:hypothetical protein